MAKGKKEDVITFKVDESLSRAMGGIPNRSEFIRSAILAALESTCPLCSGTGIMTPDQRRHWADLAKSHTIGECKECHAVHIVCTSREVSRVH